MHADFDFPRLSLFGFRDAYLQNAVFVRGLDAVVLYGFRKRKRSPEFSVNPLHRAVFDAVSFLLGFPPPGQSKCSIFYFRWKSSFYIPGSSARIRYASLLSKTSTGGYHVAELGFSQVRPKLSPNKSLIRACIRFKLSNGSHLTNSIIRPPFRPCVFAVGKLSMTLKAVNSLDRPPVRASISPVKDLKRAIFH